MTTAFFDKAARRLGARRMISDAIVAAIYNRGQTYAGDIDRVRQHMLSDFPSDATPATDPTFIAWVLANHPHAGRR